MTDRLAAGATFPLSTGGNRIKIFYRNLDLCHVLLFAKTNFFM